MLRRKRSAANIPAIIEISSSDDDKSDVELISNKRLKIQNELTTENQTKKKGFCRDKTKKNSNTDNKIELLLNIVEDNLISNNNAKETGPNWQIHELLAENQNLDLRSAKNLAELFADENTIPFICRYRRDMINSNITPEKLRDIKNTYNKILELKKRSQSIITILSKENKLTDDIHNEILSAKTAEQLEFLYAPYKPTNKKSLAERAKSLGLDKPAEHILFGKSPSIKLEDYVSQSNTDLNTIEKVSNGICNIIIHIMSKSSKVLEELTRLEKISHIVLKSNKVKVKETKSEKNKQNEAYKFETYFNFESPIKYIKPHNVLAINRGENLGYLAVKIDFPDKFKLDIKKFLKKQYLSQGINYTLRTEIFEKSFEECYKKKLKPLVTRQIRSNLNENAKKASIEVFAKNLKQLLLMSPLKGNKILGIDPGFTNGCKLALISETSDVLETDIIYPHGKFADQEKSEEKLIKMLTKHGCKTIALGNGSACRETEIWLSDLFNRGFLDSKEIHYSIVSEQGASIYSCSDIAKKEFPNLDVNLISAVSIARRLNDPLSEYVKIEPRHIGVGMYQHDISEKSLNESLIEVVSECVSFVGVDINTAGLSILKHVSGLTAARAEKIIEFRTKNGPFKTRKDLLKVKGIGQKIFTQFAGFIRIEPLSLGGKIDNLLDCTWIHPENYDVAEKILEKCNLNKLKIGKPEFINTIKNFKIRTSLKELEKEFNIPEERISFILEALQRELCKDYRSDINRTPLFKKGIVSITQIKKGSVMTGGVTNVTHFGVFVDIGVEKDGLIHCTNLGGVDLNIGDRVKVTVIKVDIQKKYINLKLEDSTN